MQIFLVSSTASINKRILKKWPKTRDSDCKGLEPLTAETLNKLNRNREHIKFAGGRVCEAEAWRA